MERKGTKSLMPYFPMFFCLDGRKVLVVGAGRIGARRIETLLSFGADVMVVAPEGDQRMEALIAERNFEGRLVWERRSFRPSDADGKFLVIAAADDPEVNDRIVSLCRSRGILVNHAGDQSQCDFYFPGIARDERLVIGVCSSGLNHRLVREAAAALRTWLKEFSRRET